MLEILRMRQERRSRNLYVCLFLCVFLAFILTGLDILCAAQKPQRSGALNVLFITLDTTRADRLGCYGYEGAGTPHMDSLAAGGVKFVQTYSSVPLTLPSHCSIFTGTYPLYHRVHNNGFYYLGEEHVTLAEVLKKNGYKTAAFVSSFTVDSRFGLDQGFETYDDTFDRDEILKSFRSERRAAEVFRVFSDWLDRNGGKKFFCWIHFYDPHLPYDPPSPFKEKFSGKPYDGEIAYMDHYVGNLVTKLREKSILGDTLIVIVGDHGEALGERRELDHGLFIYDNTLKVPYILHCPEHIPAGVVVETRVNLIDVMPTILDMIKLPVGKEIQGVSCLDAVRGKQRESRRSYIETYFPLENFGWSPLTGLIEGKWKFIQAPKPELYNLETDPEESHNVFQKEVKVSRRMVKSLENVRKGYSTDRAGQEKRLTKEEERRLRSLGYIGAERMSGRPGQPLPDPKDKIEDYILYFQGNLHETRGEFQKAAEFYKEVLRRNPDVSNNYVHLGFLYAKTGRMNAAIKVLEQGRERLPESYVILSKLIMFYSSAGRYDDALSASRTMLGIDSRHFDALFLSGSVHAKLQNWAKALEFYKKAMAIEPENKTLKRRYAYTLAALGRHEEALERYGKLASEYPGDSQIFKEISEIYRNTGNLNLAVVNLKKAVELNPAPDICYDYAFLLEETGQLEEGIRWLKKYLDEAKDKSSLRWRKAQVTVIHWEKRLKNNNCQG